MAQGSYKKQQRGEINIVHEKNVPVITNNQSGKNNHLKLLKLPCLSFVINIGKINILYYCTITNIKHRNLEKKRKIGKTFFLQK